MRAGGRITPARYRGPVGFPRTWSSPGSSRRWPERAATRAGRQSPCRRCSACVRPARDDIVSRPRHDVVARLPASFFAREITP